MGRPGRHGNPERIQSTAMSRSFTTVYLLLLRLSPLAPSLLACGDDAAGASSGGTGTGQGGTSIASVSSASGGGASSGEGGGAAVSGSGGGGAGSSQGGAGSGGDAPAGPFWRLESPQDSARTWLVSPEGERTFALGVNTVMRDKTCDGIRDSWIRRVEPTASAHREWARLSDGESGGERVEAPYCFNSVGAFSDTNDFDDGGGDSYMIRPADAGGAGAPYGVVLNVSPRSDEGALRDENGTVLSGGIAQVRMGDPFHPAFLADLQAMARDDVAPRRSDPRLQQWFAGNEIGIFDKGAKGIDGVRDFRRWIWTTCPAGSTIEAPQCASHALAAFLRDRYATLVALNAAWGSTYAGDDFLALLAPGSRPVPYAHDCEQTCRTDLQVFTHDVLLREWVRAVTTAIRAEDPDHLVTTPRLALGARDAYRFWAPASGAEPDRWVDADVPVPTDSEEATYCPFDLLARDGDAGFDLIAVNVYSGDAEFESPWFEDGIQKLMDRSGLPLMVSEFSVRALISGWTNKGGAGSFVPRTDETDDQIQRGAYYRSQIEQLARFPRVVGASWHAWSDRYAAADPAHQINMGLMQCDDPARGFVAGERWDEIDDRIAATNCRILELLSAATGL